MRTVAVIFIAAGLGAVFLWQKNQEHKQAAAAPPPAQQHAATSAGPSVTAAREPSEHNWMKRSLDRARDVTQQARSQTRDSQNP